LPGFEPADNHLRVSVKLKHPALAKLLQRAYSAEKAAAFAYIGHAASLKNPAAKVAVKQIEDDEWSHRQNVLAMMQQYDIPISRFYEFKFHVIGRVISASCHVSAGSCLISSPASSRAATSANIL
jgi:hypothetical protein